MCDSNNELLNKKYRIIKNLDDNINLVLNIENNVEYIMKNDYIDDLRNELKALRILRYSNNIVNLIDDFTINDEQYLILEKLETTLYDKIMRYNLDKYTMIKYMRDLILAVYDCHSNGIIHCDIKPQNIMIAKDNTLKLIDFNLCHFYYPKNTFRFNKYNNIIQSSCYRSPESCNGISYVPYSVDIWSIGMILYYMYGDIDDYNILLHRELSMFYTKIYKYNNVSTDEELEEIYRYESMEQLNAIYLYFGCDDDIYDDIYDRISICIEKMREKRSLLKKDDEKYEIYNSRISDKKYVKKIMDDNKYVPLIKLDNIIDIMDDDILMLFRGMTSLNIKDRYDIDECSDIIDDIYNRLTKSVVKKIDNKTA